MEAAMPEEERKIKKYKVVKKNTQRALARRVQHYLKKGWELQGGVSSSGGFLMTAHTYTQTLVLYEKK